MQCVILAAGRGERMRPLTDTTPKPLIKVAGKAILDHIVLALPSVIDELVVVVGYRSEQIEKHCGEEFHGRKVVYVEQADYAAGTGDALLCAKDVLKGKFLFMYGDDIHGKDALEQVIKKEHAIMGYYMPDPGRFGLLIQNEDDTLKHIAHGSQNDGSQGGGIVNIGGFVVDLSFFDYDFVPNESGELYVTDLMTSYAQDNQVEIVLQDLWIPVGYPEDIAKAEKKLEELSGK